MTQLDRWLRQWRAAVRENLDDAVVLAFARGNAAALLADVKSATKAPSSTAPPLERVRSCFDWLAARLQYRFEGEEHRTLPLWACLVRVSPVTRRAGWGACSDFSAVVAAVALRAGCRAVVLHYEEAAPECLATSAELHSYAHAQIEADGEVVDPLSDVALARARPTASRSVRELLGWPATATS